MYCCAHKTATLTPIQHTVGGGGVLRGNLSPRYFGKTTPHFYQEISDKYRSSTCPLTSFFWLLSHVIYLKLTKELKECLLS